MEFGPSHLRELVGAGGIVEYLLRFVTTETAQYDSHIRRLGDESPKAYQMDLNGTHFSPEEGKPCG